MLFLSACGDDNLFSWANDGDGSSASLTAQGDAALNAKDYDKAYDYYNKALQKSPSSSEARYGRAAARFGQSGVNILDVLVSSLDDGSSSPAPSLAKSYSSNSIYNILQGAPGSSADLFPLSSDQLHNLYMVGEDIITDLKYIADGYGDGSIPANDPHVNINLAFFQLLQAALYVLDSNGDTNPMSTGDLIDINDGFNLDTYDLSTMTVAQKADFKKQVKKALVYIVGSTDTLTIIAPDTLGDIDTKYQSCWGSIHYLDIAIQDPNFDQNGILKDLKDNFNELAKDGSSKTLKDLYGDL